MDSFGFVLILSNKIEVLKSVCVCVCVCARARVCVCVCAHVCVNPHFNKITIIYNHDKGNQFSGALLHSVECSGSYVPWTSSPPQGRG